jgi:uncharacterized membrane protein YcaP (DUF421 family)
MSPEEIYTAVRASGHASLAEVEAVVLETDGSVSVVESTPRTADRRKFTRPA